MMSKKPKSSKPRGGHRCAVLTCENHYSTDNNNLSFFRFPKEKQRCKYWIENCERLDLLNVGSETCYIRYRVCSKHFEDSMFWNYERTRLLPVAIPTLFMKNSASAVRVLDYFVCASVPISQDCNPFMENSGHLETKMIEPQYKNDSNVQLQTDSVDEKNEIEDCNRFMENSGHLEIKMREPQSKNEPDFQLQTNSVDTTGEVEMKVQDFEEVYIKEEPLEIIDSNYQDDINHDSIKKEIRDDYETSITSNSVKTNNESKKLKCEICSNLFTAKCYLSQHMKSHKEKKKFQCEVCHKEFPYISMLKNHIEIHNEEKKWKCIKCNELYRTKRYLQKHMKYHDDPTEFRCNLCNKLLLNKYSLKDHMKIHSGLKKFHCPTCKKSFTRHLTLKRHIRLHIQTEEFHCTHCDRSFTRKGYLQQHMKLVHYSTEEKIEPKDSTPVEEIPRDSQIREQLVLQVFKEEECSDSEKCDDFERRRKQEQLAINSDV